MSFFRKCFVVAACFAVLTSCSAKELDAATCDQTCNARVQWYWASSQTLARQFYGAVIANTPEAKCVASKESATAGLYQAQNASGASGKYQFMPSTGDTVNRQRGRYDLVGLPARLWPDWEQDAAFGWAWARWGGAPWLGECGSGPLGG